MSSPLSETVDMDDLVRTKVDLHLITGYFIMIFAFNVQFMVFPTYVELEKRSTDRFQHVSMIDMGIVTTCYIAVGTISLLLFGSEIKPDVLLNVSSRPGRASIFIRLAYTFLLTCHLPYFFFSVKEYVLVIIDELKNRSLSTHLEQKLSDFYKKREDRANILKMDHPQNIKAPETPSSPNADENQFEAEETD